MNLQDYIASKTEGKQKAIPAEIRAKHEVRVTRTGLFQQGRQGAQIYLRDNGKGIAAPKCIFIGRLALELGQVEFAYGMFEKAAQLEGVTLSDTGNSNAHITFANGAQMVVPMRSMQDHPGFPREFQPGRFAPMQPVDGNGSRDYYIMSSSHWGQPKVDGNKEICFVTANEVFYQSRQMKLKGMYDPDVDATLRNYASIWGNFILEGERTFLDWKGGEHRTGPQALTANIEMGEDRRLPIMRYVVFSCLWQVNTPLSNYGQMVDRGHKIATELHMFCPAIYPIMTAKDASEKAQLVRMQQRDDREGEIWFDPWMDYCPGKNRDERIVRTKYLTELEVVVNGFTATTAEDHAFGAMEIESLDGKLLGSVGTGFTREDKRELLAKFLHEGQFKVEIRCQGFTEGQDGKPWHARFLKIVE